MLLTLLNPYLLESILALSCIYDLCAVRRTFALTSRTDCAGLSWGQGVAAELNDILYILLIKLHKLRRYKIQSPD